MTREYVKSGEDGRRSLVQTFSDFILRRSAAIRSTSSLVVVVAGGEGGVGGGNVGFHVCVLNVRREDGGYPGMRGERCDNLMAPRLQQYC